MQSVIECIFWGFEERMVGENQWIATGFQPSRWQGCRVVFDHIVNHTLFVIARRERKWRTRQSIVSRVSRSICLFAYWFTVDRHGLSALAMTRRGEDAVCVKDTVCVSINIHSLVIARRVHKQPTRQSIVSQGSCSKNVLHSKTRNAKNIN